MAPARRFSLIEARAASVTPRRDIIRSLPTELVHLCFSHLDLRRRIFVSHVSRAWRTIALSDRFLWNEAGNPETGWRHGAEILRMLLDRSDPLPFSFSWESSFPKKLYNVPPDMMDLICRNMHRMQELSVQILSEDDSARLFQLPAPLLRRIFSQDMQGSAVRADLWPRLEVLRIIWAPFTVAPQPFASVRIFSCWDVRDFADSGISLFSVFPALEHLHVGHITGDQLGCVSNPPVSLTKLALAAMLGPAVDYTPVLRGCRGLGLKIFHLHPAHEAAGVLELFSATAKGPWSMELDEHDGVRAELREDGPQERSWSVGCDARISFSREPRLAHCLAQLESLTGSTALLVQLYNLDGWSRALPALRTLTVQLLRPDDMDAVPVPRAAPPFSTPLLGTLTLWLPRMTGAVKKQLETDLPALIPAILERPPPVIVDVADLEDLDVCDIAPLAAAAEGVEILERRSRKITVYALSDRQRFEEGAGRETNLR